MNTKLIMALILTCVIATGSVSATTIVLCANDCQDVTIKKGAADQNWGALRESNVSYGNPPGSSQDDFLMRYDLSSIPPGQVISNAVLTMELQACHALEEAILIPFYKMLKPWVEGTSDYDGATWNESDYSGSGANAWQTAGAKGALDREQTSFASGILNHENGTRTTWDITSAVQDWYTNPDSNYGWLASSENSVRYVSFWSSDKVEVEDRPVLTIEYGPAPREKTIVLGADKCQDVSIRKHAADQNWGALRESNVTYGYPTPGSSQENFLMRYDLSSIPEGQDILSAELTMELQATHVYQTSVPIPFYKMLKPWVEGTSAYDGATWNESDYSGTGANAWQVAGAAGALDREQTYFAAGMLNTNAGERTTWDITSEVEDWYANPDSNYGWLASSENVTYYVSFWSSDKAEVEDRPVLTVMYAPRIIGTLIIVQ